MLFPKLMNQNDRNSMEVNIIEALASLSSYLKLPTKVPELLVTDGFNWRGVYSSCAMLSC